MNTIQKIFPLRYLQVSRWVEDFSDFIKTIPNLTTKNSTKKGLIIHFTSRKKKRFNVIVFFFSLSLSLETTVRRCPRWPKEKRTHHRTEKSPKDHKHAHSLLYFFPRRRVITCTTHKCSSENKEKSLGRCQEIPLSLPPPSPTSSAQLLATKIPFFLLYRIDYNWSRARHRARRWNQWKLIRIVFWVGTARGRKPTIFRCASFASGIIIIFSFDPIVVVAGAPPPSTLRTRINYFSKV